MTKISYSQMNMNKANQKIHIHIYWPALRGVGRGDRPLSCGNPLLMFVPPFLAFHVLPITESDTLSQLTLWTHSKYGTAYRCG